MDHHEGARTSLQADRAVISAVFYLKTGPDRPVFFVLVYYLCNTINDPHYEIIP